MKTVKIAWRKRKLDAKAGVYSRFASVFELKIMKIQEDAVQEKKNKEGYENWPESFQRILKWKDLILDLFHLPTFDFRAVSGNVLGNHKFCQPKQTRPPIRSLNSPALVSMHTACKVNRKKHQVLFNDAPTSFCKKRSVCLFVQSCVHVHFGLILAFPTVLMDHFARLWRRFYQS